MTDDFLMLVADYRKLLYLNKLDQIVSQHRPKQVLKTLKITSPQPEWLALIEEYVSMDTDVSEATHSEKKSLKIDQKQSFHNKEKRQFKSQFGLEKIFKVFDKYMKPLKKNRVD